MCIDFYVAKIFTMLEQVYDFDEDGELGVSDLTNVLDYMMLIPQEYTRSWNNSRSRFGEGHENAEQQLQTIKANIKNWAEMMIAEVDTTGTKKLWNLPIRTGNLFVS
eukprot:COSAG01_NODE_48627_length_379_cov_1.089286_1_plen_106_part_01